MERSCPGSFHPDVRGLEKYSMASSESSGTDNPSLASSEDSRWSAQIGGYDEDSSQWAPPSAAVLPDEQLLPSVETLVGDDLEAMLEQIWHERWHRLKKRSSLTTMSSGGTFGYSISGRSQSKYQLSDEVAKTPPPPLTGRPDSYPPPLSTITPPPLPGMQQYPEMHSPMRPPSINGGSALDFRTFVKKRSAGEGIPRNEPSASSPSLREWGPLDPQNPPASSPATPRRYHMPTGRRI